MRKRIGKAPKLDNAITQSDNRGMEPLKERWGGRISKRTMQDFFNTIPISLRDPLFMVSREPAGIYEQFKRNM